MDKIGHRAALLEKVILAWDQAVEALLQDVERVNNGGRVDEANSALLLDEVERARLCCETLARQTYLER